MISRATFVVQYLFAKVDTSTGPGTGTTSTWVWDKQELVRKTQSLPPNTETTQSPAIAQKDGYAQLSLEPVSPETEADIPLMKSERERKPADAAAIARAFTPTIELDDRLSRFYAPANDDDILFSYHAGQFNKFRLSTKTKVSPLFSFAVLLIFVIFVLLDFHQIFDVSGGCESQHCHRWKPTVCGERLAFHCKRACVLRAFDYCAESVRFVVVGVRPIRRLESASWRPRFIVVIVYRSLVYSFL